MEKTLDSVSQIFPEAERILDVVLRRKVLETWLDAWKATSIDRIEDIPFLPGILPDINVVDHTRTVTSICLDFANTMQNALNIKINRDYLLAGSLLHDLGKVFEYSKVVTPLGQLFTHPISAVHMATRQELPLEVINIIATHSLEGDFLKRSLEATVLHFLDFAYTEVVLNGRMGINATEWRKTQDYKRVSGLLELLLPHHKL